MKLTDVQLEVLRKCALCPSRYVPVTPFKGKHYIVFKDLKDDVGLNIQGDTIAPLFESGYLEMSAKDTCIISDAGRQVLECVQNSTKGE